MIRWLLVACLSLLSPLPAVAEDLADARVQVLLAAQEVPDGVLFEVVEADEDVLDEALERIIPWVEALRRRFPGLEIAVVSHGQEMFSLTRDNLDFYPDAHRMTRELVERHHVSFHVCGAFAAMNGVEPEEFPAYVDVAASGPAQVNDYVAIGFTRITLDLEEE